MKAAIQTTRSWFWKLAVAGLLGLVGIALVGRVASATGPKPAATSGTKQWNILVITSDEHNPKIMGCAGHSIIKTPGVDRLAREGTMCTKAYAADPICAPTRQSLMTANYPQEHGQFTNSHIFNENLKTWAHHFKQHGYLTACIGKMHTNNEECNFGFDYRSKGERKERQQAGGKGPNARGKVWDANDKKVYDASPDTRFSGMILNDPHADFDGAVLDDSLRWLRENCNKKFFLHASFVKPHWPWDAPREFYYMYDPATIDFPRIIPGDLDDDYMPRIIKQRAQWDKVTESMHRVFRARYYGSLSWLDSNVRRILDTLDELRLAENTLVVYATDHGDMAGEKGLWLKSLMFDGSVRIPLVVRMPGVIPAGKKCDALINHVDLFPTIASLAGAAGGLPANITGKDYSQALLGKTEGPRYTFSVHEVRSSKELPGEIMARSQRWKFICYPRVQEEKDKYVLYDMDRDPDEITNLANRAEYRSVVAEHKQAIESFMARLKPPQYPLKTTGKQGRNFKRD